MSGIFFEFFVPRFQLTWFSTDIFLSVFRVRACLPQKWYNKYYKRRRRWLSRNAQCKCGKHKYHGLRATNVYIIEFKIWSHTYIPQYLTRSEGLSSVLLRCSRGTHALCSHGHIEQNMFVQLAPLHDRLPSAIESSVATDKAAAIQGSRLKRRQVSHMGCTFVVEHYLLTGI